ncbi:hypothetical protein Hanom_Chr04g00299051 [Helianthus anomalus]
MTLFMMIISSTVSIHQTANPSAQHRWIQPGCSMTHRWIQQPPSYIDRSITD